MTERAPAIDASRDTDPDAPAAYQPPANDPAQVVDIAGNERVFLVGKTGSGKTFWAMVMLATVPRLVVVDIKGSDTISEYPWREPSHDTMRLLESGRPVRVRVREKETALAYMAAAYNAGGCIVYVDEVMMLVAKGGRPPVELENIWTRGRELGVGGWAATQRPVYMPLWLVSESEWTVCFRLKMADDRKRMAEDAMGPEVMNEITDPHGFFVARDDWERPNYYPTLNLKGVTINGS